MKVGFFGGAEGYLQADSSHRRRHHLIHLIEEQFPARLLALAQAFGITECQLHGGSFNVCLTDLKPAGQRPALHRIMPQMRFLDDLDTLTAAPWTPFATPVTPSRALPESAQAGTVVHAGADPDGAPSTYACHPRTVQAGEHGVRRSRRLKNGREKVVLPPPTRSRTVG